MSISITFRIFTLNQTVKTIATRSKNISTNMSMEVHFENIDYCNSCHCKLFFDSTAAAVWTYYQK